MPDIQLEQEKNRILSIDFFRGFTMFLLVGGFSGMFGKLNVESSNPIIFFLGSQFEHAEWIGLRFWDLVQPFFMFIVGVAMPFSFTRRWKKGDSWNKTFKHVLTRSALLLLLGWMLGARENYFNLTNVLAQLSVTYLIAFLLMRKPRVWQLLISFVLILTNDLLYQFWPVEGFNQPYVADHNFGSWFDIAITGNLGPGGWVAFNAFSTTAHTIWGVLAGTVLLNTWPQMKKVKVFLAVGIVGAVIGYVMGIYIPIIKHICTSSFIIVSGGWCFIALGISYWLIDVLHIRKGVAFFAVVGMNPLFIYLFSNLGGKHLLNRMVEPFSYRLLYWTGEMTYQVGTTLIVAGLVWYICYFLYQRSIFIRI
ncbi:MAG: DUF5009 domain-containing protein [Cyclobacteriaceae bacterium]|nr:DUF5009 domain-containing protein [Cyclobacteriaceae bacterium]